MKHALLLFSALVVAGCRTEDEPESGSMGGAGGAPMDMQGAGAGGADENGGGGATGGGGEGVEPKAGAGGSDDPVLAADAGVGGAMAAGGGGGTAGQGGVAGMSDPFAENPGSEGDGDVTVGPNYTRDPDLNDRGAPKGRSFQFTMDSADSQIYRGDDVTLNQRRPFTRRVFVYVPASYKDGTDAPVLIIHDGPGQLGLVQNALDNLTISKDPARKLPPFIAIAVAHGGGDGKGSQRGLEYDTMSDRFARFINDEVFPAVSSNPAIKAAYPRLAITKNPWGRGSLGCSSGGAAAMTMAWFRPDLFRRVITYSGTLVDQQDDDAPEEKPFPFGAWEYHSSLKLIESNPQKPLRVFLHVSERDGYANNPESTHYNWVMANQRTAAALKKMNYHYQFVFSRATGHCDGKVFDETLADALVWVWRGYQAAQ